MIAPQRSVTAGVSSSSLADVEKRGIPFDYAFRYKLTGEPGRVLNSVVTVSIEATFVALSIGYGVVAKVDPIIFGPQRSSDVRNFLFNFGLGQIVQGLTPKLIETSRTLTNESGPEAVLKNGIKLNPQVADIALANGGTNQLPATIVDRLFQVVGSPSELIQFMYAIFDEGSGREFQSEPILNIAGLGSATGERPFRYFAQPIIFKPRSTIRMEVTEVSDFKGELHVSLHGYKVLGDQQSATGVAQNQRRSIRRR